MESTTLRYAMAMSTHDCCHPRFNTLRVVPYHMWPQGVPDVVDPLEAIPQEVLEGFNQPFLDVGQPPIHLTISWVPPPLRYWPMTVYPLSKLVQLMPHRQLLTPTEFWNYGLLTVNRYLWTLWSSPGVQAALIQALCCFFASGTHKQQHRYYSRTTDLKASWMNTLFFDRQAYSALMRNLRGR